MRLGFFLCIFLVSQVGCLSFSGSQSFYKNPSELRTREDYCAKSTQGMVTSAHPEASRIGKAILLQGGNAIDAALATSFAISVLRPQSTGIGGGGFMLIHKPQEKTLAYDFRERAPLKASYNMYLDKNGAVRNFCYKSHIIPDPAVNGHLSVATPGLVAGLLKAHAEHGLLPLGTLISPAIKLAREGFIVYSDLAEACKERQEILNKFEDSAKLFLPKNRPLKIGELLIQSDLAWTLEQLALHGAKAFYDGPISEKIIAEIKDGKGILSAKDLKNYEVKMRDPLESSYRGHKIIAMPPPSSGGVHIVEMLNILEHFDLKSMGPSSTRAIHILAETMKRAFADRANYLGDPDFINVPLDTLLSDSHAAWWAKNISLSKATDAHELTQIQALSRKESPSTTHISVVDKNGIAVSTTQTINYAFGSGVTARGTGIVLNDEMDDFSIKPGTPNIYGLLGNQANAIAAYKTMLSSMSPTLVFDADNNLKLVVGSPGGPRIINATLQTIINVIDHDMSLADAVHSFRIHHQWLPDVIRIEPKSLNVKTAQELKNLGHKLKEIRSIGDVQAIQVLHKAHSLELIGVSDTRSNGKAY